MTLQYETYSLNVVKRKYFLMRHTHVHTRELAAWTKERLQTKDNIIMVSIGDGLVEGDGLRSI